MTRINNVATYVLVLFALLSACTAMSTVANSDSISVLKFRAVPNDGKTDRQAIQECIIAATKENKTCFIPAGEYTIDGDLWVQTNTRLLGEGDKTVLNFSKGALRALKNGSKTFYYKRHYINEIIPGQVQCTLTNLARKGVDKLVVDKTGGFKVGDYIFTFNNRKDTWKILEDKKHQEMWNGSQGGMARSEIFRIVGIEGNSIVLDRPMRFVMPEGSPVTKHVGSRNVTVESLKIVNFSALQAVIFEQPFNACFLDLTVEGNGGIWLLNHPYGCMIKDSRIKSTKTRAVSIHNFAVENSVINNVLHYTTGGDCAVIVMLSSYDNEIAYNKVYGDGKKHQNEGGIYIHATSFNNRVHHNFVSGVSGGISTYYGAFDNLIYRNTCENISVGTSCWFSGPNIFKDNSYLIGGNRSYPRWGAYIYGSRGIVFNHNTFSGDIKIGFQMAYSSNTKFEYNTVNSIQEGKGFVRISKEEESK